MRSGRRDRSRVAGRDWTLSSCVLQARRARAAAITRVRHGAVRGARGAGGGRAAVPRRARRPVGRRAGAARDAGRR